MKNTKKKDVLQKTIISIIIVLLFSNFIVPTYSQAANNSLGGVLMDPVTDFLCTIGDGVINLLQKCMQYDWAGGFSLGKGGFLKSAEDEGALDSSATGTVNKVINPYDADEGFNKTLIRGKTQEFYVPVSTYSPEQIFTGSVAGLDINFIHPNTYTDKDGNEYETDKDGKIKYDSNGKPIPLSSAGKLQSTIATWYVALRNLTVVGLLSVLVYVGIRIILSSTAADKAKYKQMLTDWLIALCILFFLHYIMSFVITMTESITQAIAGNGEQTYTIEVKDENGGTKGYLNTNLLGAARFQTQYNDFGDKMAYLIMYLALVIYTCTFTFFYLKRLLTMAFLTLIAPVVALTYPIDKISDGKAQAFDSWLKEYIFNALIQPFHLIIYTVFVGSAMDLAANNIIYMIAALGFILPAEKILRNFFGFNKAGAGTLGQLAGAAAIGSIGRKLIGGGAKAVGAAKNAAQSRPGEKPPRTVNASADITDLADENATMADDSDAQENNGENIHFDEGTQSSNTQSTENNSGIILPESYTNRQRVEEARRQREEQEAQRRQAQQTQQKEQQQSKPRENRRHPVRNLARHYGPKAITGAAKFATRTAFKATAGTLSTAVALASGSSLAGAFAAGAVGWQAGGRLANGTINLASRGADVAGRVLSAYGDFANADYYRIKGDHDRERELIDSANDEFFTGTRMGRVLDVANGKNRYEEAAERRAFKNDENNIQAVRKEFIKEKGYEPSSKEIKEKMNEFDPYLRAGLIDIQDMLKAQRAEQFGISRDQAAIIAAIGKKEGISASDLRKDGDKIENKFYQQHIDKGYTDDYSRSQAKLITNVLKAQNGEQHNLKTIKQNTNDVGQTDRNKAKAPRTKK